MKGLVLAAIKSMCLQTKVNLPRAALVIPDDSQTPCFSVILVDVAAASSGLNTLPPVLIVRSS